MPVHIRTAFALLALTLVSLWPSRSHAYAWMIRRDYTACAMCHADPSGGALLTPYGRALGETVLRTRYDGKAAEEPGKVADFAFGAVPLPESLLLGADVRWMHLGVSQKGEQVDSRGVWMQADLQGQYTIDRFRVNGAIGYADEGALPASITHKDKGNVVSRVHWVGIDLGDDKQWLVRAGRMNLPFGVRSIEHTLFVRSTTRTDTKAAQQHGVAVSYNGDGFRAELMAIAGNFQVAPAAYRDHGYSGYAEWAPLPKLAVGVSSLVTHAEQDILLGAPAWRQVHGGFGRYSPIQALVITAEVDALYQSVKPGINDSGYAAMVQADVEPFQGVHVGGTFEAKNATPDHTNATTSTWLTAWWFFAPHADVRLDWVNAQIPAGDAKITQTTTLLQLHGYL